MKPKILFSCSGTMIKTVKILKNSAQLKKTSGIFGSDLPNFVSHNVNLKVKKGYIMVSRGLKLCHRYWLIRSHCLYSKTAYVILSQLPPLCGVWMCYSPWQELLFCWNPLSDPWACNVHLQLTNSLKDVPLSEFLITEQFRPHNFCHIIRNGCDRLFRTF